jgi:16S rRNA (guanine527-N7)-methyltransferase
LIVLTNVAIQNTLTMYGFCPDQDYCERVRAYIRVLLKWNRKIPLTTIRDPLEILRFHFGEGLMGIAAARMEFGRLADVGSGAGFPGAPIAMAKPHLQAILIEANGKKAAFLEEVRRELGLKNVQVHRGRAESVPASEKFEFVAARAVGRHAELLTWASQRLVAGGKVALWVGSEGLAEVQGDTRWEWHGPAQIPGTRERFVAVATFVKEKD